MLEPASVNRHRGLSCNLPSLMCVLASDTTFLSTRTNVSVPMCLCAFLDDGTGRLTTEHTMGDGLGGFDDAQAPAKAKKKKTKKEKKAKKGVKAKVAEPASVAPEPVVAPKVSSGMSARFGGIDFAAMDRQAKEEKMRRKEEEARQPAKDTRSKIHQVS